MFHLVVKQHIGANYISGAEMYSSEEYDEYMERPLWARSFEFHEGEYETYDQALDAWYELTGVER
jgi:hypothetical protein